MFVLKVEDHKIVCPVLGSFKLKPGRKVGFEFLGMVLASVGRYSAWQRRRRRPVKPEPGAPAAGPAQERRGARHAGMRATGRFRRFAAARRAKE